MFTLIQSKREREVVEEEALLYIRTMTMPPDCSAVHMLIMGAMPIVVPWK